MGFKTFHFRIRILSARVLIRCVYFKIEKTRERQV